MLVRPCAWLLVACLLLSCPSLAPGAEADLIKEDETTLKNARIGSDGPALLAFVRKNTLSPERRKKALALVEQLGSDDFDEREEASDKLDAMGPVVLPLLRAALKHPDIELRKRAAHCIKQLEPKAVLGLTGAAARLLAARKPAGAAGVLLTYLPDALDQGDAEAVRAALVELAGTGGKADPALVAGLSDTLPLRRGAAAEALGRARVRAALPAVRKLLKDRDVEVRLRAATGLVFARDKDAVGVLIALLVDLPGDRAWEAEELLRGLARESAPELVLGDTAEARRKCRAAWSAWWTKARPTLDMSKLASGAIGLGYTLMVLFTNSDTRVTEVGRDGKPLWTISGLDNGVDARILPGKRVLIAEHGKRRVTERTFTNKIVWEKSFGPGRGWGREPVLCQRLPNGNTFITLMNGIVEVNSKGKEVFKKMNLGGLRAAHKYRDGRIGVVTSGREYIRLDRAGKEEARFRIDIHSYNTLGGVDFLPGGGLVVSQPTRVVQYNPKGKIVWQARVDRPDGVTRLPNGNTLVASTANQHVLEIDRSGKVVRKFQPGARAWLARRR
jgi:hypothetical protein